MSRKLARLAMSIACGAAMTLGALAAPATATTSSTARPARPHVGVIILPGTTLPKDHHYQAQRADFVFQSDGNLVDYDETGHARWATGTDHRGETAVFQKDGNLVVYNRDGRPLWASHTERHSGAVLAIQDDGNVVIYDGQYPLWATGTNH